jgi:hypothetical protein
MKGENNAGGYINKIFYGGSALSFVSWIYVDSLAAINSIFKSSNANEKNLVSIFINGEFKIELVINDLLSNTLSFK